MNRQFYFQGHGSEFDREFPFARDGFAFETNGQEWETAVNRSSADYIRWVQQSLNAILGLRLKVDGDRGPQTRSAIRSFQKQKGLKDDGIVGAKTEAALIAAGGAPRPGASSTADFDPLIITVPPANQQRSSCPQFTLVAIETPGGGRIQNKTIPDSSDIVIVQGAFAKTPLHRLTAEALNALVCAARADGIKHPQLLPTGSISGFRSVKVQEGIWKRSKETHGSKDLGTWVGKPGFSAHQSGRAIDFYLGTANDRRKVEILRQTPAYKWMVANAHRFGFYPYPVEPWHWEYNPPASAQPEVFSEVGESFEYEDEFAEFGWGPNYSNDVLAVAGELSSTGVNRSSPVYIQWVQNSLNKILGLRLLVDGDPGPQTRSAIRSFQRRAGLDDDGKVGAQTERALIAAGASTPSGATILPGSTNAPVSPSATSTPALITRGSAPKLLGSEKASYGETLYLQIGLGMGKNLASTGIYIPNSFRPDSDIVVVLYLHGWKNIAPGNEVLINGYWDGTRFPFFALREEVGASGRNVIFVAPSLGNKSEAGSLIQRGGFDAFMQQVLAGFNEHFLMPRHGRRINDVQSIILAAHSGGGSPMLKIARGTDQYAMKVKECWCFDSMYGPVASDWIGWAKSHPQQSLYVYSGDEKGNKRVLPRDNAEGIAREAMKQRLPNVCVQPSRAKSAGKASAHFWVPIVHLKERLLNSPCLAENSLHPQLPTRNDDSRANFEWETINHESGLDFFWGLPMPGLTTATVGVGVPVLHLSQIRRPNYIQVFTRKQSGFEAYFCDDLPSPQVAIALTGKLLIEENGVRRPITAVEMKKWQPGDIVNRVYAGRGVSASTSPVTRIKPDGSFTTESMLVVDSGTRRIRVQVSLDFKGGRQVTADAIFQHSDFDCFLPLMDSYESRRPIGRVTGSCHIAFSHFEFLSSVRKMFQPAPGSSLAGMFDSFLHRNQKICQLAAVDSAEGRYIRTFENLAIDNDTVDIGHVLVGIEASRRQQPDSVLPWVRGDATTEALMTWAGDLGSALEPYAEAIVDGRRVDIKTYLGKAGFADLFGDIDGINIGSVYDETKSLSENLRKYYGTKPFRRFHDYLARLTDEAGKPLLTLAQNKPPRIDQASRQRVSHYIEMFAIGAAVKHRVSDRLTQAQQGQFYSILQPGSKEMNIVTDYFFAFIEAGLAKES